MSLHSGHFSVSGHIMVNSVKWFLLINLTEMYKPINNLELEIIWIYKVTNLL
jgi:hypothetical protein